MSVQQQELKQDGKPKGNDNSDDVAQDADSIDCDPEFENIMEAECMEASSSICALGLVESFVFYGNYKDSLLMEVEEKIEDLHIDDQVDGNVKKTKDREEVTVRALREEFSRLGHEADESKKDEKEGNPYKRIVDLLRITEDSQVPSTAGLLTPSQLPSDPIFEGRLESREELRKRIREHIAAVRRQYQEIEDDLSLTKELMKKDDEIWRQFYRSRSFENNVMVDDALPFILVKLVQRSDALEKMRKFGLYGRSVPYSDWFLQLENVHLKNFYTKIVRGKRLCYSEKMSQKLIDKEMAPFLTNPVPEPEEIAVVAKSWCCERQDYYTQNPVEHKEINMKDLYAAFALMVDFPEVLRGTIRMEMDARKTISVFNRDNDCLFLEEFLKHYEEALSEFKK